LRGLIAILAAALLAAGCTSNRLGESHAVEPWTVGLCFAEPAVPYNVVGRIHAQSARYRTTVDNLNAAIGLAREQAARRGANAILLDQSFTERWEFSIITFIFFHPRVPNPSVAQDVAGEAVRLQNPHELVSGCVVANGLARELF
jgi:hypothetical protein